MQCRTHPTKSAAQTCNHCGSWLCDDCIVGYNGRQFCRPCHALIQAQNQPDAPPPPPKFTMPPFGYNKISGGLLFFFSLFFPPGANYMYMGLMKRGLATMASFFLIIFLIIHSSMPLTILLGLSLPVFVITSIFDGFNVRRRINMGETVKDDLGEILNSILRNKFLCTFILVVIAIIVITSVLGFAITIITRLLPLIVVGLGVYLILKSRKKS